jgi:IMP dehydrogenase
MLQTPDKIYLTYDDVNIVPAYSEVQHRTDAHISPKTQFTKNREILSPIISAPMDTVTEYEMAYALWTHGGVGIIHRFNNIEEQCNQVIQLKQKLGRYENYDESLSDADWFRNPPIACAIGVSNDYLNRAKKLVGVGANVLLIDVAHGHHKYVKVALRDLKSEFGNTVDIIAGNVATANGAVDLQDWGADAIRVGIGNGSLCETRIRTGVGVPQVSALLEISPVVSIPIIADGGVRYIGDICKALAAGADSVMLGSLLAGTRETPGPIDRIGMWPNEVLYKRYQGSASASSKRQRGENEKNVEGNSKLIPYKGKIKRLILDINEGIYSSFGYVGATNIDEFHHYANLIRVTSASHIEGLPHLMYSGDMP